MKKENQNTQEILRSLVVLYRQKICSTARLSKEGEIAIEERLKEFTPQELTEAIVRFSEQGWYMMHHSQNGITWFFNDEDQIAKWLGLQNRKEREARNSTIIIIPDLPKNEAPP